MRSQRICIAETPLGLQGDSPNKIAGRNLATLLRSGCQILL